MQLKASPLCQTNMGKASKAVLKFMNSPYGLSYSEAVKMAKKKNGKKKAKKKTSHTPAVRHLRFRLTLDAGETDENFYLDIAKNLSGVNRRLYRQGKHYFVKKVTVTSRNTDGGLMRIGVAPNSWMLNAGWKMGRKMFNKMRLAHGGAPGSGLPASVTPATWADFKVYLNADHKASVADELQALDMDGNGVVVNEWRHSIFTSPDSTGGGTVDQYDVKLLGSHDGSSSNYDCVGLIDAYRDSRRTVQHDETGDNFDPDSPWMKLFDDGDTLEEVVDELKIDGDMPPYDLDVYTGTTGNMPEPIVVGQKAVVRYGPGPKNTPSVTFGGFTAPCGLIRFGLSRFDDSAADTWDIVLELAEGSYKGVKALDL